MGVGTGLGGRRPEIAVRAPVPRPFEHIIVKICLKSKISWLGTVSTAGEVDKEDMEPTSHEIVDW